MSSKTVLIGGGTGLIGRELERELSRQGHRVRILTRNPERGRENHYHWDVTQKAIDLDALDGVDWVMNLAGVSVTRRIWTKRFKKELIESRIGSNDLLIGALKDNNISVENFISASAIGYYGDRADEELTEGSRVGDTFLAGLCQMWEQSADRAQQCCAKVTKLRIGMVLSKESQALKKLMALERFGLYPCLGNGENYLAWIHLDDLVAIFLYLLNTPFYGVFNACSPEPVRSKELCSTLAQIMGGRTVKVPAWPIQKLLPDMSGLLLHSARAEPKALIESQFDFTYSDIASALQSCLKR